MPMMGTHPHEWFMFHGAMYGYKQANYMALEDWVEVYDGEGTLGTPISKGNIQARLRMIYLYNLASIHKGLVMSTDNQTEYQLGFWTIHGDVG